MFCITFSVIKMRVFYSCKRKKQQDKVEMQKQFEDPGLILSLCLRTSLPHTWKSHKQVWFGVECLFSLSPPSYFPNITQIPRDKQSFCKWLLETSSSAPAPNTSTLLSSFPSHVLKGKKALKSLIFQGFNPCASFSFSDTREEEETLYGACQCFFFRSGGGR